VKTRKPNKHINRCGRADCSKFAPKGWAMCRRCTELAAQPAVAVSAGPLRLAPSIQEVPAWSTLAVGVDRIDPVPAYRREVLPPVLRSARVVRQPRGSGTVSTASGWAPWHWSERAGAALAGAALAVGALLHLGVL